MRLTLKKLIESEKLKCIICDFDNTLFSWEDVGSHECGEYYLTFMAGENFYEKNKYFIRPIDFMQDFCIRMRHTKNMDKMFIDTHIDNSSCLPFKLAEAEVHYPGIFDEVYGAATWEHKMKVVDLIADANGYSKDEILYIDDIADICDNMRKRGYNATSPIAVYTTFYSSAKKGE